MNSRNYEQNENFIIGPIFENVIVGQLVEMKKILNCDNTYIKEFLHKIADKHFL